jgi:hypothetical protein
VHEFMEKKIPQTSKNSWITLPNAPEKLKDGDIGFKCSSSWTL